MLRRNHERMAWTSGGEEEGGLHVRPSHKQSVRMGATWRNLRVAHWAVGSGADGDNVLEHDPPHEERQGALQQLHDQVLAKGKPGPHQGSAQRG
eukprot:11355676-Heterocapsa_arctica.AAC.1